MTDVCLWHVEKLAANEIRAELLSTQGTFVKFERASWDVTGKPRAGGVEQWPPGLHLQGKWCQCDSSLQSSLACAVWAACSHCWLLRGAGVQEVAGERFSQGPVVWLLRLYQCSGYWEGFGLFACSFIYFLPVLNSLCEYQYSESPRTISAFIRDSFQLPFNCL